MKNYIAFIICFSTVYCILTNTQLERKSSSKMEFGAKCSSSYPTDIYASAYLIRKSDGKVIARTYGSDKSSVSYSISKAEYIDKSTEKVLLWIGRYIPNDL